MHFWRPIEPKLSSISRILNTLMYIFNIFTTHLSHFKLQLNPILRRVPHPKWKNSNFSKFTQARFCVFGGPCIQNLSILYILNTFIYSYNIFTIHLNHFQLQLHQTFRRVPRPKWKNSNFFKFFSKMDFFSWTFSSVLLSETCSNEGIFHLSHREVGEIGGLKIGVEGWKFCCILVRFDFPKPCISPFSPGACPAISARTQTGLCQLSKVWLIFGWSRWKKIGPILGQKIGQKSVGLLIAV